MDSNQFEIFLSLPGILRDAVLLKMSPASYVKTMCTTVAISIYIEKRKLQLHSPFILNIEPFDYAHICVTIATDYMRFKRSYLRIDDFQQSFEKLIDEKGLSRFNYHEIGMFHQEGDTTWRLDMIRKFLASCKKSNIKAFAARFKLPELIPEIRKELTAKKFIIERCDSMNFEVQTYEKIYFAKIANENLLADILSNLAMSNDSLTISTKMGLREPILSKLSNLLRIQAFNPKANKEFFFSFNLLRMNNKHFWDIIHIRRLLQGLKLRTIFLPRMTFSIVDTNERNEFFVIVDFENLNKTEGGCAYKLVKSFEELLSFIKSIEVLENSDFNVHVDDVIQCEMFQKIQFFFQ